MKKFGKYRRTAYSMAEWIYAICGLMAYLLAFLNSIDGDERWVENRPIVLGAISRIQDYSIWIYILIGLAFSVCFIYRRVGNPWVWQKIQFILDEYQNRAFANPGNSPRDHHRVTLFRHRRRPLRCRHWSSDCWWKPAGRNPLFSKYLVPECRSAHLAQNSRAMFYAPDTSDDAEGVAAQAWARREVVIADHLPALNSKSGVNALRQYARKSFCSMEMVKLLAKKDRPMPRSIAAIPVLCHGELWGTLVLDSRDPEGVNAAAVHNYTLTIALIGHLLEEA